MPVWTYHLCETRTGIRRAMVSPSRNRWKTQANGIGDGEAKFELADADVLAGIGKGESWRLLTKPWVMTLVSCWDDRPVYAGVIRSRPWDPRLRRLTVQTLEVRAMLKRRMLWPVPNWAPGGSYLIAGHSRRSIVASLIRRATSEALSSDPRFALPIATPAAESGTESREWFADGFQDIDSLISVEQDQSSGPDVWFEPEWDSQGRLRWQARIGTPILPGPALPLNVGAALSPIRGISLVEDGTDQVTNVFALGKGSGADMLVARATTSPSDNLPILDRAISHKQVESHPRLQSLASAEVAAFHGLRLQTSITLDRTALDQRILPGARPTLWFDEDPFIQEPSIALQVIAASGTHGEEVDVEVVPA